MNAQEFTKLVQLLDSNLKADLSNFDVDLDGYQKYYSEIEFSKMKKEYSNIIHANQSSNPTTYSYIHDIFSDITIAYTGIVNSDEYPPFGLIDTSRYIAKKAKDGNVQAIFLDFGLLWVIQLISDVLVSHLLSYQKEEYSVQNNLSRLCGITLHLIDHKIHELGNDFEQNYEEMTLASYLQYAISTFVCAHEFIHYVCSHDGDVENEYYADVHGAYLTLKVMRGKIGDDRIGIIGIIIFFLFISVVKDLDKSKPQDILLEPKNRLKHVLDNLMPDWILVSKNTRQNIVDKLFVGECIDSSLNLLYNEIDYIFQCMSDIIKKLA